MVNATGGYTIVASNGERVATWTAQQSSNYERSDRELRALIRRIPGATATYNSILHITLCEPITGQLMNVERA